MKKVNIKKAVIATLAVATVLTTGAAIAVSASAAPYHADSVVAEIGAEEAKENKDIDVEITSNGIRPCTFIGMVYCYKANIEYEYLASANSMEALKAKPENIREAGDGNVAIKVSESFTMASDKKIKLKIHRGVIMDTLRITGGYDGACGVENHDRFCRYDFANYKGDKIEKISIDFDKALTWYGGYIVKAEIKVGDKLVMSKSDS